MVTSLNARYFANYRRRTKDIQIYFVTLLAKAIEEIMKIVILDGYTANPGDLGWEGLEMLGVVKVYDRTRPSETVARAMANRCCASPSIMRSKNWVLRRSPLVCFATTTLPLNATSPSASASQAQIPIRLTGRNGKV